MLLSVEWKVYHTYQQALRRVPPRAQREPEFRRQFQVQPRQLRERLERRQLPPVLLQLIYFLLPLGLARSGGRSFIREAFLPATKHAADFV